MVRAHAAQCQTNRQCSRNALLNYFQIVKEILTSYGLWRRVPQLRKNKYLLMFTGEQ